MYLDLIRMLFLWKILCMRTSAVCKKIVLCGIYKFLVGFRSDGVVWMLCKTLCRYGFIDIVREAERD